MVRGSARRWLRSIHHIQLDFRDIDAGVLQRVQRLLAELPGGPEVAALVGQEFDTSVDNAQLAGGGYRLASREAGVMESTDFLEIGSEKIAFGVHDKDGSTGPGVGSKGVPSIKQC